MRRVQRNSLMSFVEMIMSFGMSCSVSCSEMRFTLQTKNPKALIPMCDQKKNKYIFMLPLLAFSVKPVSLIILHLLLMLLMSLVIIVWWAGQAEVWKTL